MDQWLVGIVSGIISGLLVSGGFYWMAGRDLRKRSTEIKKTVGAVARWLEHADSTFNFDEHGVPKGIGHYLKVEAASISTMVGDLTVMKSPITERVSSDESDSLLGDITNGDLK